MHSDLGRVVHAIIREFEKFPPKTWPNSTNVNSTQQQQIPNTTQKGEINISSIPELCNLSLEELQRLDQDQQYLNDFVDEIAVVQRIQHDLDTLIENVKTVATENLGCHQRLHDLKSSIELKLNEFRRLGDSYDALNSRYQKKSDEFAPHHIKELLQIAVSNADGICDKYVEEFLNGSMDVQQFLDQYREAKRISAIRKAKEERLTHQLNEFERATF